MDKSSASIKNTERIRFYRRRPSRTNKFDRFCHESGNRENSGNEASTVFSDLLRASKPRVLYQTELFSEVVNADDFSYEICCSL